MCKGLCPKCRHIRDLTKHHILPQRFFRTSDDSPILYLCRGCHNDIERHIPKSVKLDLYGYLEIAIWFLEGAYDKHSLRVIQGGKQ